MILIIPYEKLINIGNIINPCTIYVNLYTTKLSDCCHNSIKHIILVNNELIKFLYIFVNFVKRSKINSVDIESIIGSK
jgi:hypothetical protein